MANIKEQISDFRKSTPKHIQWLLLVAAFIVVLILLTLLFTGRDGAKPIPDELNEGTATEISFSPAMLDFGKTPVGTEKTGDVAISATNPIKILDVNYAEKVEGFELKQSCKGLEKIDNRPTKCIYVTYAPKKPVADKKIILTVSWRLQNAPDGMQHTTEYYVTLGATGTAVVDTTSDDTRPVIKKEDNISASTAPVDIADNYDDEEDDYSDDDDEAIDVPTPQSKPIVDTPVKQNSTQQKTVSNDIRNDIKAIAPSDPFANSKDTKTPADNVIAPEVCSDFAIPGYGPSGSQIGWIKPERGAYYFHPFSDKDCKTPTGIYNPDNGIITDIKGNGKRIGTDAEHIGYSTITNGTLPKLSNPATKKSSGNALYYDASLVGQDGAPLSALPENTSMDARPIFQNSIIEKRDENPNKFVGSSLDAVYSSQPYDRRFILRQYKPIPATIVSEVRADPSMYNGNEAGNIQLPVRATVDRNVYADNGRTIIIPTGTLMLGYVTGSLPGPYTSVGRMQIKWYQFILPNGVEFNFAKGQDPFSADSQGRAGVPGRGSTDYLEQFVMPMLTAIVPAAVNMIAPVADKFVNQIDLDNNTVVQSGTMRSSELAKNEIITAWNQVAQKLLVDMMDNTTPPFSIAAGTRITVYSPEDLIVSCGTEGTGKDCAITPAKANLTPRRNYSDVFADANVTPAATGWVGQVREFKMNENWCTCDEKTGACHADQSKAQEIMKAGYSYSSIEFYCQTTSYSAINNVKQDVYFQNQAQQFQNTYGSGNATNKNQAYNEQVLGLKYEDSGAITNPFAKPEEPEPEQPTTIGCLDGTQPDANGCCTGEIYTDMGEEGFNCCPESGGDCFPPIL